MPNGSSSSCSSHLRSTDVEAALLTIYEPPADAAARCRFTSCTPGRKIAGIGSFSGSSSAKYGATNPTSFTRTPTSESTGAALAALFAGAPLHRSHRAQSLRLPPHAGRARGRLDAASRDGSRRHVFRRTGAALSRAASVFRGQAGRHTQRPDAGRSRRRPAAARERLGVTHDEFAIMVVGRMEYQKNHMLALARLRRARPTARRRAVLFFVGSGENETMLRGLARALRDRRPRPVSRLPHRRAGDCLPGADLLLMTSWFEGMPLALLEAMLAGVPIVTTPWYGRERYVGRRTLRFSHADFEPGDVAAQIERAIAHPANAPQRRGARANARARDVRHPSEWPTHTAECTCDLCGAGLMMRWSRRLAVVTSRFPFGSQEAYLTAELAELARHFDEHRRRAGSPAASAPPPSRSRRRRVLAWPLLERRDCCAAPLGRITARPRATLRAFACSLASRDPGRWKNVAVLAQGVWRSATGRQKPRYRSHARLLDVDAVDGRDDGGAGGGVAWSATAHRWDIYERNAFDVKERSVAFVRTISERGSADARVRACPASTDAFMQLRARHRRSAGAALPRRNGRVCASCARRRWSPVKGHAVLFAALGATARVGTSRCTARSTAWDR